MQRARWCWWRESMWLIRCTRIMLTTTSGNGREVLLWLSLGKFLRRYVLLREVLGLSEASLWYFLEQYTYWNAVWPWDSVGRTLEYTYTREGWQNTRNYRTLDVSRCPKVGLEVGAEACKTIALFYTPASSLGFVLISLVTFWKFHSSWIYYNISTRILTWRTSVVTSGE